MLRNIAHHSQIRLCGFADGLDTLRRIASKHVRAGG